MSKKSEAKWRQNYYMEVEKTVRRYEYINKKNETKIRKASPDEQARLEEKLLEREKFLLKIPDQKAEKS